MFYLVGYRRTNGTAGGIIRRLFLPLIFDLFILTPEHLGQQVKISRRRKHSDYLRQVRYIFDFDLFHSEHLGRALEIYLSSSREGGVNKKNSREPELNQ